MHVELKDITKGNWVEYIKLSTHKDSNPVFQKLA